MKQWITTIVLGVLLAGGGVFSGVKIVDMTEQLNELESSHAALQTDYSRLQSDYSSLEFSFHSLESSYSSLESDYSSLQSKYKSLRSDYDVLQGKMSQLESRCRDLQAENESLRELLKQYENVPHGYYSTRVFPYHLNTLDELRIFLSSEFWLPRNYEVGIFDCSESAAYVEWALENSGFDARIAVGAAPWNPGAGYHAWILVYFSGSYIALDPTALTSYFAPDLGLVGWESSNVFCWRNYYEGYDSLHQNIYCAIRDYGRWEWNWWEGYWGFI